MSNYDYNDVTRNKPAQSVLDARARKVTQVYKEAQTNTDPRKEEPPPTLPDTGVTVTADVVDELNKALYHLQQVVLKLRGGK